MKFLAVIDTNVIVAAMLSKKMDTGVVKILKEINNNEHLFPLWHEKIIEEYNEVLYRAKFNFSKEKIKKTINAIQNAGIYTLPIETEELPKDPDDVIFWQIAMAERKNNAYLITGNIKHYPDKDYVVTPSEMIEILELQ